MLILLISPCLCPAARGDNGFEFLSSIFDAGAREVEVSGNIAYSLFFSGLLIIDYGDPSTPTLLGRCFFREAPTDLRLRGDRLFVADSTAGICVLDVSDPASPMLLGRYSTGGEAMGLDLKGDTLYVANGSKGILVLSSIDPDTLRFIAELEGASPAWAVDIEGGYAYVASLNIGLRIIRVSELPDMIQVARVPLRVTAMDVRVALSHAYLADFEGLATVDVSDPEAPILRPYVSTPGKALDLFIEVPNLYLADNFRGFHIFDIETDPDAPLLISASHTPDDAMGIAVDSGFALVADDFAGLLISDVSDPVNPESLGTFRSAGENRGGVIRGDLAYLAQGRMGVWTVDITDRRNPAILSSFTDGVTYAYSLDVSDTVLVLANNEGGVMTINVSDPASPFLMGEVSTGREVTEVKVSGSMAYVVDGDFRAIDLAIPYSPSVVSSYLTPSQSVDLAVAGNLAFVADRDAGVHSYDISEPADSLRPLHTLDTPGFAEGIAADGSIVYIADDVGGFRVIEYDQGGQMNEVSHLDLGDPVADVAVENGIAFLALRRGEIVAVDVGDPYSIARIDSFPTPGKSVAVETSETTVVVGDFYSTILLEYLPSSIQGTNRPHAGRAPSGAEMLMQNIPNPFNPSTTIFFRVSATQLRGRNTTNVSLEVFSLRGRLVKRLFNAASGVGEHEVFWDGTNAVGDAVPSGVYVYVLKTGDSRVTRKMLLIR